MPPQRVVMIPGVGVPVGYSQSGAKPPALAGPSPMNSPLVAQQLQQQMQLQQMMQQQQIPQQQQQQQQVMMPKALPQSVGPSEKEKEQEREIERLKKLLQETEERDKAEKSSMDERMQQMQVRITETEKKLAEAQAQRGMAMAEPKGAALQFAQMVSVLLQENAALRLNSEKMIAEAKAAGGNSAEQSAAASARVAELERQLAAAENEKMQLSQQLATVQAQLSSGSALEEKQKELDQALQTIGEQENTLAAKQVELDQALRTVQEQEARIKELTAKNAELSSTATKAADALTSVSVKFKQCTQLCADEKDRANQAVAMVASLKTQLDEQKRRGDSLEQANTAIKDKVENLLSILRAQGWHPGLAGSPGSPGSQPQMAAPAMQQQVPMQPQPAPQSMVDISAIAGEVFPQPQR